MKKPKLDGPQITDTGNLYESYREARFAPALRVAKVDVAGVTPSLFARWLPILGVWGVGAGAAVLLFASDMCVAVTLSFLIQGHIDATCCSHSPKFKSDILDRIPVVREYCEPMAVLAICEKLHS